jgi:hypothetical protein
MYTFKDIFVKQLLSFYDITKIGLVQPLPFRDHRGRTCEPWMSADEYVRSDNR